VTRSAIRFCLLVLLVFSSVLQSAQSNGKAAYDDFTRWRSIPVNRALEWDQALEKYRGKLKTDGASNANIESAISAINTYDEAELYDRVYTEPPQFNTKPNKFLMEAVKDLPPGQALDVAMGQGRNSIPLATKGWQVTGFDVSGAGLNQAKQQAAAAGITITAVLSSDEDFDFGVNRWDLIAVIYALEKRSVQRAREALKPGGMVVVEAGHKSASGAPFEYESDELPAIFKGFQILRYEEATELSDWGKEPHRIVRLVARKPR
jgi:2-polyprenyl-3-methyl-5-hydroxy-6-metoxy-1,4-benzoquinol methylase